jgi:translocation and assembly module TamB
MGILPKKVDATASADADSTRVAPSRWWKTGGQIGLALLGLGGLGFIGISLWVSQNLAPTIAEQLTKALERDVKVGPLTGIGFNEISFGPSSLGATAENASRASVKAIKVGFDPLGILWQRTIKPSVTLVEPNLYLEQNAQGSWLKLPAAQLPESQGFFNTEMQRVTIQRAKGTIVPYRSSGQRPQIPFQGVDFNASFKNREGALESIDFNGGGQIGNGATLNIKGSTAPTAGTTNLDIAGAGVDARQASDLLQLPAVSFRSGQVDGNIRLEIKPRQPLNYQGNFQVKQATIQVIKVPELFQQTSGDLTLDSQMLRFSNVSTVYGKLPGQIAGSIDFRKGYNLTAQIPAMPAAQVLATLKTKSPVAINGKFSTELSLSGALDQPVLSGTARSAGAVQIDKLALNQLSGDFSIANGSISLDRLIANPSAGGTLQGSGTLMLAAQPEAQPQIDLTFRGRQLPANILAQPYQDLSIPLGLVDGTARITGPADNISTNLTLQAPQAQYPLQANLTISPQGAINLRQGKIKIAGREISGSGNLNGDIWQAQVQVPAIETTALAALANPKDTRIPDFLRGRVSGNLNLQGNLQNSERIAARGQIQLATAAGIVSATNLSVELPSETLRKPGKWQADLQTSGLQMAKVNKQIPGRLSGKFQVMGGLTSEAKISAQGSGSLDLPSGRLLGQNLVFQEEKWRGDFSSSGIDLAQINPSLRGKASGQFAINGDLQNTANIQGQGQGIVQLAQGRVVGKNLRLDQGQWQGDFQPEGLEIGQFNPALSGKLNGEFNLAGSLDQPSLERLQGSGQGRLDLAAGKVVADGLQLQNGRWQGNLALDRVRLGQLSKAIPMDFQSGVLNGRFQVAGAVNKAEVALSGDGQMNWNGGQIAAQNLQLKEGAWQGNFAFQSIALDRLPLNLPPAFRAGLADGNVAMAGRYDKPSLQTASGNGRLRWPGAGATAIAQQFSLNGEEWRGRFQVTDLPVGQFARLPQEFANSRVTSTFELAGNLQQPQQVNGAGAGRVVLGSSQVEVPRWQLGNNRWQVTASTNGLDLGIFPVPGDLQGSRFVGKVDLSGSLDRLAANGIAGQVNGALSIWGGNLALSNFTLGGGRWQGQFAAQDLALNRLATFIPNQNVRVIAGRISGQGQGSGSLDRFDLKDFSLDSNLALRGLQLAKIPLEQNLQGRIKADRGNLDLQLAGQRDRLALNITDRGLEFAGNLDTAKAQGRMVGDLLQVTASGLPMDLILGLMPPLPQLQKQQVGGILGGDLSVNLKTGSIASQGIVIDRPQFGIVTGDRLQSGALSYANGALEINSSQFQRGKYSYEIPKANFSINGSQPEYQFVLNVPNGSLADVSSLFQIFNLEDLLDPFGDRGFGRATDLQPAESNGEANLNDRLQRQSELNQLQAMQQSLQEENPLPDLRSLKGDFKGTIVISNAAKQGVYASFNVQGEDWSTDKYQLSKVDLQGKWQNNALTLGNLELFATTAKVKINGVFGFDRQQAEIEVDNFQAENLSRLLRLPVEVAGDVKLKATLGGSWLNPTLKGQASIPNGKLNQGELPEIDTNFSYTNSRLDFNSSSVLNDKSTVNNINNVQDPLRISGSIPYQLPFSLQSPDNNEFWVDIKVKNQGLRILSILTQQQADWVDGIGEVNLGIQGKVNNTGNVSDVVVKGEANFRNGVVQSIALPNKLTAVTGKVSFDFDRVQVVEFNAKYGQGEVRAKGGIQINNPQRLSDPLEVNLDKLQVDLKDKYIGGISGRLVLGNGSILQPSLSGDIQLFNGRIILPETASNEAASTGETSEPTTIQYNKLVINLKENVQVDKPPILSFLAAGQIELNSFGGKLQPEGTIRLQRGQANLFTSRFRLKGDGNTVTFSKETGTDPILNVLLTAKALETSRPPTSVGNERAEKTDLFSTSLGQVQTIQVDARVVGPASQINERLELSSKPPRNRDEILILLGSGLGQFSGSENAIGLGLLNLASSTFLNNVQESLVDLLGLSDFRIYPSITTAANNTSVLGLAAEAGVDLNSNFSASLFKILTSADVPQYSIRYRIDNNFLLRGSTNLSGDNRFILEFDRRF